MMKTVSDTTPAPDRTSARGGRRSLSLWELAAGMLMLSLAGLVLLYVARDQWFFGDEWNFLLQRSAGSLDDLLRPHNEHWSTLPILAYRGLFTVFGLTTYVPYMALLAALHVSLGLLVAILLRRSGAPLPVAWVAGVLVVLFGAGAENLLWAFQIGFVGSLLAFVGALLVLDRGRSLTADLVAAGLLLVSVMCSGLGVAAVAAIGLTLAIRGEFARAMRVCLLPTLAVGVWFLAFRGDIFSAHGGGVADSILLLPEYVVVALSAALDGVLGFGRELGVGFLVVVFALVGVWILARDRRSLSMTALAPLLMGLGVLALTGLGRAAEFGIEQAVALRYTHIVGVLLILGLGAMFFSSDWYERHRSRALTVGLTGVLLVLLISSIATLRDHSENFAAMRSSTKAHVVSLVAALDAEPPPEVLEAVQPVPLNPDITVGSLILLLRERPEALPSTGAIPDEDVAVATARMQFRLSADRPPIDGTGFDVVDLSDATLAAAEGSCIEVIAGSSDPFVVVEPYGEGLLRIATSTTGIVETFGSVDGTFTQQSSASVNVAADATTWIWVTDSLELIRIDLEAGSTGRVCSG